MIRVHKPGAPKVLTTRGRAAMKAHCTTYDASPPHRNGTRRFDFDRAIYAAGVVKDTLKAAQHFKCAFCESWFEHVGYGDVEHFRPKGGFKQEERDKLQRPGYYWLAYRWSNLFASCQLCNQQFKKNAFPLKLPTRRVRSHAGRLAREEPLLVDPAKFDPGEFIGFRQEYAFAVDDCREGEVSIRNFGLNRPALVEVRRGKLADVRLLVRCRDAIRQAVAESPTTENLATLAEVEADLQAKRDKTAPYSAMIRAYLNSL